MNTLIMAASYLAGSAMVVQKMLSLKDFRKTLNSNEYRIYSNTIRILIKPAPLIEPAVVLSKFPIKPAANLCFHEIEPADCNRINTVVEKDC